MIRDLLAELPIELRTDAATTALMRQLRNDGVVTDTAELGGGETTPRRAMSETIRKSYKEGTKASESLQAVTVTLDNLYRDNRKLAGLTLLAGLLAAFACVAVVLWVVVAIVRSERDPKVIEYASSVVPGLLSATLFYLHRFQQSRLDDIQNDIRTLDVAGGLLRLADGIDHQGSRKKAFDAAIDMIVHSRPRGHSLAVTE